MPVELVIAPEAESDIAEAYLWYEDRRAGLGEEFLSSVEACLESIRRRPEMYPVVHEGYRRLNPLPASAPTVHTACRRHLRSTWAKGSQTVHDPRSRRPTPAQDVPLADSRIRALCLLSSETS